MKIKAPAVAGTFYPIDSHKLSDSVKSHLQNNPCAHQIPQILIVPHAGHQYSGPIAATGYNTLKQARDLIDRVVIIGPNHRAPLKGIAGLSAEAFSTPLGNIDIDRRAIASLCQQNKINLDDSVHHHEHCLEVQLPFLQNVLHDFTIVPLVVGEASPAAVEEVLTELMQPGTLIIVSTDLSHYHNYQEACEIDRDTADLILNFHTQLRGDQACGCHALNGALLLAKHRYMSIELLDLRNSGDTAGDHSRVVGYGCFSIH